MTPGKAWQLAVAALLLSAPHVHAQDRFCGRDSSRADLTYVCGKAGGYIKLTDVMLAMNARVGAQRYWTINELHLHFYDSVTIPTDEAAFMQWVKSWGLEVASQNEKKITFRVSSSGWRSNP